jgi:hypothetical protein
MSVPLTITQIVKIYAEDVASWARERGGKPFLARDPAEPYELIAGMGPNDFRVVVSWAGDKGFGGNIKQHLDKHTIEIWIGRSRGLAADPNGQLVYPAGDKPALLDLVESAKQRVLELLFPEEITRRHSEYIGAEPVTTPNGIPMAAYKITVTLDAAGRPLVYRTVKT